MEELQARHRKEAKELQGRITSKKKNATKKTRRGVNDECAGLEAALKERHAAELAALTGGSTDTMADGGDEAGDDDTALASGVAGLDVGEQNATTDPPPLSSSTPHTPVNGTLNATGGAEDVAAKGGPHRKGNRQKARLARRAADQIAASEAAAREAESLPDLRRRERETLDAALAARGFVEHEVRSDGHCLYAAVADQLVNVLGETLPERWDEASANGGKGKADQGGGEPCRLDDYMVVRAEAADEILRRADEYAPFLDADELEGGGGDIKAYARRVRETGEWGGQLEILACARRWRLAVNVLQGDGRVERIEGTTEGQGDGALARECWLVYYRHSFGLGEHYNSLRRREGKAQD